MANKKFWSGILIMALVFGTAIIGCDNAANDGSVGGGSEESGGITYTVEANGTADTETSTQLDFTFSAAVSGLKIEDIEIIDLTGKVVKNTTVDGTLTGDDTNKIWTLLIYKVTAGKIRVMIEKEGIERGRKTLNVYKNSATGGDSDEAILLSNNIWEEDRLDSDGDVKWYKFEAESGANYFVRWDDKNGKNAFTERIYIRVSAYQSDGTTKIEDFDVTQQGCYKPVPLSGVSGTVYLKVETAWFSKPGTFAIKFYDQASIKGPRDVISIYEAKALADISVKVIWSVYAVADYYDPLESVGCKVYRSDTEHGDYEEIGDVSEIPEYRYESWTYIDTTVTAGKTYWYKVAGYDDNGDVGAKSDPKESELIQDVDAGTVVLTVGGGAVLGEFTAPDQVFWYKFEAEPGISYWVEQDYESISPPKAAIYIHGFKSDKTPIEETTIGPITGVSGTVYLKATYNQDPRNNLGNYGIRVDVWVPWWESGE